jgi:protein-S-isoprenylcysteine O-methyltransferase Ste14
MIDFLARKRIALGFVVAVAVAILARPSWESWRIGLLVAGVGEGLRVWAAGHLEKGREVTRSGPYRWTAHPLYVGSSVIAAGVAIASHSHVVVLLAAIYMGATITAAVRTEEAFLRRTFGPVYDEYRTSGGEAVNRPFSVARAVRNREYRAIAGLAIGFAFLALKVVLQI